MVRNLKNDGKIKGEKARTLDELGLSNIPEARPSCPGGHKLKFQRHNPYKKGNVSCDSCIKNFGHSQFHIDQHDFFYHCDVEGCEYDICRACAMHQCGLLQ